MKNITTLFIGLFMLSFAAAAQNNSGKADDEARISITPQVTDQQVPSSAKNMLINKMKQICSKNGMSGAGENPFFIMEASVDIMSKEITPTAPPMHALYLTVNFEIKDVMNGNVYSQTSIEVKGVGTNESKAYNAAIKQMNTNSGQFKAFIEKGKERIIEFYNSDCDFILSKAKALKQQGENGDAIKVLRSTPPVCKECFDKCMALLGEIEPPVEEEKDEAEVTEAGAAVAEGDAPIVISEQEIDDNIFLCYTGNKLIGNSRKLYFKFENRGGSDYELSDYAYDTRVIDGNGVEHKLKEVYLNNANLSSSYIRVTIIDGVPVPVGFEFENVESVGMFEFKYKNRLFRFKDIKF